MFEIRHKAVIGLGNPGTQFEFSPHNAGYALVDALAAESGSRFVSGVLPSALVATVTNSDTSLSLVKPTTGMNDSGRAFAEVMSELSLDLPEILVVFDDLSLPLGKLRFRDSGRSTAGHRGLASIFEHVPEHRLLSRLKIGVGPDPGGANRFAYVTSPMPGDRRPLFAAVVATAREATEHWRRHGLSSAMSFYNAGRLSSHR
jgi:PTH1 family peptidyl-tRNA hydrolase